jgi:hypothetical protein
VNATGSPGREKIEKNNYVEWPIVIQLCSFQSEKLKEQKNIENNYSSFFFLLKTRENIGLHACPLVQAQKYMSGATFFVSFSTSKDTNHCICGFQIL